MATRWPYLVLSLVVTGSAAQAQLAQNLSYDGRTTVARLRYTPVSDPDGCQGSDSPAGAGWGHDYPMSVQGLLKAATELMTVQADPNGVLVLTADDPELMRHPVAMVTEPGCWAPSDVEVKSLREYLLKGGFLIVDDPTMSDNTPEHCELARTRFEEWIQRVLPTGRLVQIPISDPIFDGFFQVNPSDMPDCNLPAPGQIFGIYQDNNPAKRLVVVVNYTRSLGHRWRYVDSDLGSGLEEGGMAYRLGLNYLIYGLSH